MNTKRTRSKKILGKQVLNSLKKAQKLNNEIKSIATDTNDARAISK